ncbi:MAG: mechanosensitive ion channel [Candidatus Eisenbacteria bacterium]|nr:mechanosensitive ion channel [Candidatus Eisenbacteria bacterium]
MNILLDSLTNEWQGLLRILPRLMLALAVFWLSIIIGRALSRALGRLLQRGALSTTHKKFFQGTLVWFFGIAGVVVALNLLGLRGLAASLVAGGGITAVVLGFAFREIGENFLAGIVLAFNRPFEVGDLVESESLQGIVRGIELRHTHVRTADGRDIFIPSSQIVTRPLVNFTRDGLRRPSFSVGIDYADDADRAKELLLATTKGVPGVLPEPEPGVVISGLAPQYVELEVYFWVSTTAKETSLIRTRSAVMEACRRCLEREGYTFSSNVSTNVDLKAPQGVDVQLSSDTSD